MPKRFFSTDIWKEDWFLIMPNEYKLFWFYIISACDHAGIFKVNIKTFCSLNDVSVNIDEAISLFNNGKNRIRILNNSNWLIEDFFVFQYGSTFNPNNKVHESIENQYGKFDLKMTSIRGLKDLKERVKDKDKEIKKGGVGENKNSKQVRGLFFCKETNEIVFDDDSREILDINKAKLILDGFVKPYEIIKENN